MGREWSSDVCSSDLPARGLEPRRTAEFDDRKRLVGLAGRAADTQELNALGASGDLALLRWADAGEDAGLEGMLDAGDVQRRRSGERRVDLFLTVIGRRVDVVVLPVLLPALERSLRSCGADLASPLERSLRSCGADLASHARGTRC